MSSSGTDDLSIDLLPYMPHVAAQRTAIGARSAIVLRLVGQRLVEVCARARLGVV